MIPLIPVIANMVGFAHEVQSNPDLQERNVTFASGGLGFVTIGFPPVLCNGRNANVTFYANLMPILLIFFVGLTELILLLALIHKVNNIFVDDVAIPTKNCNGLIVDWPSADPENLGRGFPHYWLQSGHSYNHN